MQAFTDNPIDTIEKDTFGFKVYVEVLRQTLLQTAPLPFCVGIFGSWGSGKSSIMNILKEQIEDNSDVKCIWFNPWKYDQKDDLWHALIQTILVELGKGAISPEMKEKVKELAQAVTWLVVKSLITGLSAGIVSGDDLDKISDIVDGRDTLYYQHINAFENTFATVVENYVGKKGKLVVFIDDLDRCLPENAITVLEALKLFIGHAQCIFVLGMDHYVVEEGISARYEKKIKLTGRDYLDKIIQVPFYLPPVSFKKLKTSLENASGITFLPEIWEIICVSMGRNPRKTKRFVSSFLLSQEFLKQDMSLQPSDTSIDHLPTLPRKTQDIYLAKLLVFQMRFLDFYQYLQHHPEAWELVEKIAVNVPPAKRGDLSDDKGALKPFVDDTSLMDFMSSTTGNWNEKKLYYPESPNTEIVSRLLETVNLVSDSGSST